MIAGEFEAAMTMREEAVRVAEKQIDGRRGILAGPDAPGCVMERKTAAPKGEVPLWGQLGDFVIDVNGMQVRIEFDGIFGVGAKKLARVLAGVSRFVVVRFLKNDG